MTDNQPAATATSVQDRAEALADWVLPIALHAHHGKRDGAWTRLPTIDGTAEAVVDSRGFISPSAGGPSVDWWIGAHDKWVFPSQEDSTQQSLVDGTPVVETRVRVSGGEICQRVYGFRRSSIEGGGEALAIEIENDSSMPIVIALAVRPFDVDGPVRVDQVELDDNRVLANGTTVLVLSRAANGAAAGTMADGDLADVVVNGEVKGASFPPTTCPDGAAQAAVILPISHRTTLRAVIPLPDGDGQVSAEAATFPSALPTSTQVADGWHAQIRDLAEVVVPDGRLRALVEAAKPLMLSAPIRRLAGGAATLRDPDAAPRWDHVAVIVRALGELGLGDRAGELLAYAAAEVGLDHFDRATRVGDPGLSWLVVAFGEHLAMYPDHPLAEALADTTEDLVARAVEPRRRKRRRGGSTDGPDGLRVLPGGAARVLRAASIVLDQAGRPRGASDALSVVKTLGDGQVDAPSGIFTDVVQRAVWARETVLTGSPAQAWRTLDTLLDIASSTAAFPALLSTDLDGVAHGDNHSLAATAAVVSLAVALLAHADEDHVRLLAAMPTTWMTEPVEVTRLVMSLGTISYALRWHGNRPALLWEVEPTSETPAIGLEIPALDEDWHTHEPTGEGLLAPIEGLEPKKPSGVMITGLQIGRAPRSNGEL